MSFITKYNEIKEHFDFLEPEELQEVVVQHCGAWYGSNLWNFSDKESQNVLNIWNMTCRDIHNLPLETRTYLIDHVFSHHQGFKMDIFSRFQRFSLNLLNSPLAPVRSLAGILRNDVQLSFGHNLAKIGSLASIDPLATSKNDLISRLTEKKEIPIKGEVVIEAVKLLYAELRQGGLSARRGRTKRLSRRHICVIVLQTF